MKVKLNKRIYNTETSTLVGIAPSPVPKSDPSYQREKLYQKTTGEFFILRTFKFEGVTLCEIIPITINMARSWARKHATPKSYFDTFGAEVA